MSNRPRVLIVDDDSAIHEEASHWLERQFEISTAQSLNDAADMLVGADFAVVVLDMSIGGDRKGGLHFAQELAERMDRPGIVFMTGNPEFDHIHACVRVGAAGYVEKGREDSWSRLQTLCSEAAKEWARKKPHRSKPRLLAFDDDPDVLNEVALCLANHFHVERTSSLTEAVAQVTAAPAGFQVVVSDMSLPGDRFGGLRLAQELSALDKRPELIYLTAFADVRNANRCMQLGAFGYLEKGKENTFEELVDLCQRASQRWFQQNGEIQDHAEPVAERNTPVPNVGPLVPSDIFVSYSHEDTAYKDQFVSHVQPLCNQRNLTVWSDQQIRMGDEWRAKIEAALKRAALAVILISRNYLNSSFCMDVELKAILDARVQQGLCLVPVVVSDCHWQALPSFQQVQVLPLDDKRRIKPVQSWRNKDKVWAQIVREIDRFWETK